MDKWYDFTHSNSCRQDHNRLLHPLGKDSVWVQMSAHLQVQTMPCRYILLTRALIDPTAARSSITRFEAVSMSCEIINGRIKLIILHDGPYRNNFEAEFVVEEKKKIWCKP